MSKVSASFTMMDYSDGVSLITGIDSNLPLTSLYDTTNQTLNPSWALTNLTLTPRVMKVGSPTDLVSSMTQRKWYRRAAGASQYTEVVSGQSGEVINANTGVLTVSADKLIGNIWQIDYKFTGTYTDPILRLDFPVEINVTFSRVANGTSFVTARAYAVDGSEFKNGEPTALHLIAELIRGTVHDISDVSYQWAKSANGSTWTDLTGATSSTLVVNAEMIDSFAMFRCTITDNDPTSETYQQSFTSEGVSILDVTDAYQAVVESTAGSVFKNAVGSTILICRLYQNGIEIDTTGTDYDYVWTKTNSSGVLDPTFVQNNVSYGSIVATNGKAISVTDTDVDVKATFFCEVNEQQE